MLLAVEGGGFFSSSASGYSKGLTLLLLGHKTDDKPMRVSPWNHYRLVDQDPDPDRQLAPAKSRLARGCASFVCFGRSSAGPDAPSPLKVGPAQQPDALPESHEPDKSNDHNPDRDVDTAAIKVSLKSSLKKPLHSAVSAYVQSGAESGGLGEEGSDKAGLTERRKVRWTDSCGTELTEIKEFEPSEVDFSDDDFENGTERSCSCSIM